MRINLDLAPPHARHHGTRDVVHSLFRPQPGDAVSVVALHGRAELGVGRDGKDNADLDGGAGKLRTERLGEPDLRGFGGAVSGHLRDAALPDNRGHDHQVPRSLPSEDRQRRAGAEERAGEVDVHHPAHDGRRRLFDAAVVAESCVAHHDVQPAERRLGMRNEAHHVWLGRHIHRDGLGSAALRSNAVDRIPKLVRAARSEYDRCAFAGEVLREREANAGGSAGHDGNAAAWLHERHNTGAMARDPCISLLRDLVAIDSVNPSLVPGAAGEAQIAAAIAAHMRGLDLDVTVQDAAPGRPNVIGVLDGRQPGPSLMLCGHVDTVGVDGMADPFDPRERDGRLFGRGSQDMKAGVAAMIDAARVAAQRGFSRGRLILAAVVDEEYASIGADTLVTQWSADMAVVTEPTDLQIAVGHKGFAWIEVDTRGRAAHGSRPKEGRDAIVRMGRVLARLERLDRALQARPPHPIMGTGSLHASLISGGRELSSYPDRCQLQFERRTIAGETGNQAECEIREILDVLRKEDAEFEADARLTFARPPYELPHGHPLPAALAAAASLPTHADTVGMSFWTDAAILGGAGIPTVLFGPGGAGLHSTEEYVRLNDVVACRDALAALALAIPR